MNPHLQRGLLLYQQDRHALAESELKLALASDPESAPAHAYLALVLARRGRFDEAEAEARLAVGGDPLWPFAYVALAEVLLKAGRPKEAEAAAVESLRLDPHQADVFGLLAALAHDRRDWGRALELASAGLAVEPGHVACQTFRTLALLQLGRRAEAGSAAEEGLRQNPDDALAHASAGWSLLHDRRPREALPRFREALRLEPTNPWARAGMVEALKARSWLYRQALGYFLWVGRLSRGTQIGLTLSLVFAQRVLASIGERNPDWQGVTTILLVAMVAFVAATWLAVPLSNLALSLSRFGRLTLSPNERRQGYWVGGTLGVAISLGAAAALDAWGVGILFGVVTVGLAFWALPLSACFTLPPVWPRRGASIYTAVMMALIAAALGTFLGAIHADTVAEGKALARTGWGLFEAATWMGVASKFLVSGFALSGRGRG